MSDADTIKHLEAVAGSQLAMMTANKLMLSAYKGNEQARHSLEIELERLRSDLLYTQASDYKIHAFNEAAQALLDVLNPS